MWWGKIVGTVVGFLLAGPIGAFIGFFLGHLSDLARRPGGFVWHIGHANAHIKQMRQVFFDTTFLVMGHVAKSDGRVSEQEIQAARVIMQRMNLSTQQKHRAIELFNQGKDANFNLQTALSQLLQASHGTPMLLHTFVDIQLQAAQASGTISAQKRHLLEAISQQLGYTPFQFNFSDFFSNAYQGGSQHYHSGHVHQSPQSKLKQAYALLGVTETTSDADIKKAYRRLMSQHHPDKLVAKGLPEEMMKMATEKAQNIQLAYDEIRKARGF